jgi:predicted ATP-binding protein involved in virulence
MLGRLFRTAELRAAVHLLVFIRHFEPVSSEAYPMRIKSVHIQKLFGIFDHLIQMNLDERITIIYGLNGYGKTTILGLINSLFNNRLAGVQAIPFSTFNINFENGETLRLKHPTKTPKERNDLEATLLSGDGQTLQDARIRSIDERHLSFPLGIIDDVVPGITRVAETVWLHLETGEELGLTEIIARYGDILPMESTKQTTSPWIKELTSSLKVRFIESQRLLRLGKRTRRPDGRWLQAGGYEPAVAFYSGQIAREMGRKLAEYAELSQSLDQTFPMRLVQHLESGRDSSVSVAELERSLSLLEEKRRRLREAGLLEKEDVPFQVPASLQHVTQQVLPLYVNDVTKKLEVFDMVLGKIELLKRIVKDRFTFKSLSMSKERGFTFTTLSGEPLQATHLSSGEQHMLVLLSELLFTVEPNSLVLIDEPEISLHVAWQQSFLQDVKTITELASFDVLMATHSPQIVNDRWDLTVELQSPGEVQQ